VQRRGFLKKGLLGGALLALGGGGLLFYPGRRVAAPARALQVLDERTFQVMVAIAARVVPFPGADPVAIAHAVDASLACTAPESQADLRKLLGLFENALPGLLLDGRAAPFTRLDPDAQDRALERWRDSRLALRRSGYHALRRLCLGAYYADPISWPALRYRGPPDLGGFAHLDSKAGAS
jgi:Gluconate 2-dehydrogenase subunit 3